LEFGARIMKLWSWRCFLASAISLTVTQAMALTGTELSRACSEPKDTIGYISCFTYVRGLIDGLFLANDLAVSRIPLRPGAQNVVAGRAGS
jgi:hypothetical protein